MRISMLCAVGLAGMLAACGDAASTGGNGGTAAPAGSTASDGGKDVLDACATLDKAVVGQSLGATVQSAELSAVHDGADGADRYSQCAYSFGGTKMVVFGSGQSSDGAGEDVAHLTARVRKQMQEGANAPTEDVPGVGKGGLWNPELHMLYVFTGEGRFWSFTLGTMGAPDQKAAAIALARKLGA
ncbi:hypothetical protein P6144_09365 [Sphingomonas sp. HITSZ_GF]|uniref:hypothetical protein n=1 Tax=Sphingomonas sp. HITSZ_GF TaxID=3037247 RepID=UPI00240D4F3C|nr:hypothetical protein [Sphingomonas sp. HITSZ_GF]MDG2533852.1 hypothetical protein [Sphingomonas sp. HITSZ_GF]